MAEKPAILSTLSQAAIRPDSLDVTTANFSLDALWEKSYLCPCRNHTTQQPNMGCPRCHGRGIAFLPPRPLKIIIQSQEKGIINGDLGLMDSGTAIGTPDRATRVAFRDRITVPQAQVCQSMIFDVTQRRIDNGFYMVYDVSAIEFATTIDKELVEGVDYTVDIVNNLFKPNQALFGMNVSINIVTTLRYMVADLLKEHRYARDMTGNLLKLPQKLLLKREDIFIDREAFSQGTSDADVGQMIDTKRPPSTNGLNGFFNPGTAPTV